MSGCRALTDSEITRVCESIDGRYALRNKALFLLGLYTGYRISEILSLKVGMFYGDYGQLLEEVTIAKENMKGKKRPRTMPVHADAWAACLEWIESAGLTNDEYLFKSREGLAISRIRAWQIFKSIFNALGFKGKVSLHSMRKTFATKVYYATGRDLIETRDIIGHVKMETTALYIGIDQEKKKSAVDKLKFG